MLKITVNQFDGENGTIYGVALFDGRDFVASQDCYLVDLASTVFTMTDKWANEQADILYCKAYDC